MRKLVLSVILMSLFSCSKLYGQNSVAVKEMLNFEPKSLVLQLALADSFIIEGNYTNALTVLESISKECPENSIILAKLGYVSFYLGKYEAAKDYFNQLLKRVPNSLDARYGLVRVYSTLIDWERVKTVCKDILKLDKENFFAVLNLAWAEFNLKNYAESLQWYNFETFRNYRIMRLGRGWCLMKMKKFEEAKDIFYALIKDYPYDSECLMAYKEADFACTKKDLTNVSWAAFLSQSDIVRYLELVKKYRLVGKLQEALDLANEILRNDPQNLAAIGEIAKIHSEMGNWSLADYYYSVYLNRKENAEALKGKVLALRYLGRFNEAAKYAERLINVDKEDYLGYLTLGDYYYQIGEFKKALDFYVKSNSSQTLVLQGKGWSELNLKKFNDAQKTFEEILSREPNNLNALEGISEIKRQASNTEKLGVFIEKYNPNNNLASKTQVLIDKK